MARSVALAVLFALVGLSSVADASCFRPNSTGFILPIVNISGHGMCPLGFYCPNSDPFNMSTLPAVCPPTDACIAKRLDYEYCDDPQGEFEPMVCPQGFYCPTSREMYECPKGSRCPYGTLKPYKCGGLSYCPAKSRTELFLGVLLVIFLVDVLVVGVAVVLARKINAPTSMHPSVQDATPEQAAKEIARLTRKALGDARPVAVSFENLTVTLPDDHAAAPGKALLQGVSGSIRPGEVTAIMGPSGAGKTVLFTRLLGKQPDEWKTGGVLRVCGDRSFRDFPELVGYVPQDDVLRGDLTVHENMQYASMVRLPADWTSDERLELRTAVLRALEIDHVRDVLIGDENVRGVSGGQRKRCSVGVELVSAPAAVFLDEPTTGLDALTSLQLMTMLKIVAREAQIPVATVIHQPRIEIWESLDNVLLLAPGGRTVFSGARAEAEPYFQSLHPEVDWQSGNPCDHIMDIIAEFGTQLADSWEQAHEGKSPLLVNTAPPIREMAGPLAQFAYAHVRSVVGQLRHPLIFLLDVLLGLVGGALLTAAAVDSPFVGPLKGIYVTTSPRTNIQHTSMLVMLWGIALAAAVAPAGVRAIGRTRSMYWREAAAGHSRLAFYLGATSGEMYRIVLSILHFAAVVYLMWRPNMSFGNVFGLLVLYAFAHDSQAVFLGSVVNPSIAPLLAVVCGVFASLLNGFPQIPAVSQVSYSFMITEYFYTLEVADVAHVMRTETLTDFFGYVLDAEVRYLCVTFAWCLLFRVLAFVFLVMLNRDKQR